MEDFYNFDEIGFMMDIITASFIIFCSDRYRKGKSVQPDNQEWSTIIKYINATRWNISLFMIIKGTYYLANWNIELDFLDNWVIKPIING